MQTSNLSDRWSRAAAQAEENYDPAPRRNGKPTFTPANPLDRLGLTAAEVQSLTQKLGAKASWSKSVLNLVPLENPRAGWRVLIGIILITPAMAAGWLKCNFRNRKVSDDTVDAYARDMKQDQWVPTHQGVAFNDADQLIDGQHRLLAIVRCGLARELMVSFGWPAQIPNKRMTTMDAVDRGRTRSVGDQLTIQHGLANGRLIASIAAEMANLCCNERVRRLSVGNTLEVFHEFEEPLLWAVKNRSKQVGLRSAGVLAAFVLAVAGSDGSDKADEADRIRAWLGCLNSGEGLHGGGALARLRAFLTGEEQALFTPGMNRGLAMLTCQALFLELQHAPGKSLKLREEGAAYWKSLQAERVGRLAKIFEI
jgi:hypothetical protein